MEFSAAFFAVAVPAVVFAGVSKGGFGSGAAFVATPVLALILDPATALGLLLPLLMLMDLGALRPYWRRWHWPAARALVLGGVPGVALGVVFWRLADPDLFRLLIGAIALGFVAHRLARGRRRPARAARPLGDRVGLIVGAVAGFTSFVSHAGGPAAAVYLLSRGLSKTEYQATTVLAFGVINVLKLGPYAALGVFTRDTLTAGLILAPVAVAGVWLGVWLHRKVPERVFFAITYVLLTGAGTKLIVDALS